MSEGYGSHNTIGTIHINETHEEPIDGISHFFCAFNFRFIIHIS